ncbi:MAG: FKBP-type peptidyl-prolyl cis-trans isomerase [Clostridia bacterium]|nr:FKBP-type peptidyl-prolyl cis-trans isomerase [Clostridia bacterium]MBQ8738870.1 FKBP-type peptidyl-prolyl cis-trans isomerase [Clostridia bacterium]
MKKKIICLALAIMMLLSLTSCIVDQKYDYDMSKYITIPTIKDKEIEVELDSIQATIDSDIMSAASDKYTAQEGDNVKMFITIKELFWNADKTIDSSKDANGNENILFTTDVESTADIKETILIKNLGAGSFNSGIEEKFLKKKLGQEHTDTYTLPADLSSLKNVLTEEQYNKIAPYAGKDCYITYKFSSIQVREGDVVNVTYTGYYMDENGNIKLDANNKEQKFDGGSGTSKVYVGSRTFIKDFEIGLIGMWVGEEGQFKATFPDDYHAEDLKGKTVIFKATPKEIYVAPKYDLDFIKETYEGDYKSVEEFEKELIKSYASQQLLDFLVTESLVLEYPKAEYKLIKKSISDMELDFAAQYGMEFDTYLKTYLGFESRDAYIKYTMKMEMAYYAYAQKLGIAPTEADIATARAELIENYKAQYMSSSSKLTEAEALEYATSFVDESLSESDLYQEALYKLVGDHLETQYVLKEVATTYTSVSKGGSLFDK